MAGLAPASSASSLGWVAPTTRTRAIPGTAHGFGGWDASRSWGRHWRERSLPVAPAVSWGWGGRAGGGCVGMSQSAWPSGIQGAGAAVVWRGDGGVALISNGATLPMITNLRRSIGMVAKRRSFAQARRVAGYTQESLAERLGVDRTTVARWESGEYTPQPWLRPKIAEALGLSLNACSALVDGGGVAECVGEVSASLSSVEAPTLPDDVRTLVNELAVMASVLGVTWQEFMCWLSRRLVLKQGLTATVIPVLGMDTGGRYPIEESLLLAAPSCVSWASPVYEAVLSPVEAARRAASELEARAGGHLDCPANLRQAACGCRIGRPCHAPGHIRGSAHRAGHDVGGEAGMVRCGVGVV
jgi:DNA-binding XRE family transcriptional regulator